MITRHHIKQVLESKSPLIQALLDGSLSIIIDKPEELLLADFYLIKRFWPNIGQRLEESYALRADGRYTLLTPDELRINELTAQVEALSNTVKKLSAQPHRQQYYHPIAHPNQLSEKA